MSGRSYSPKEAGKMLGVTAHTTQVWDRRGRIGCIRLPTGRRRIPESEVRRILGTAEQRKQAIYARVSSHDQESDLDSQVNALKSGAPDAEVYADISSGLNFKKEKGPPEVA
jgi:putative resolvase